MLAKLVQVSTSLSISKHFGHNPLHYAKLKGVGYRVDLVRMMGEGIAKKEMARRTGLSIQTVRKYVKVIEDN